MSGNRISDMDVLSVVPFSGMAAPVISGGNNYQVDLGAALAFVPSGTGATTRTVQDKLREIWVTPEDFRLSGETDTQALTKWAAALGNGVNGRVDLDYTVTAMIVIQDKTDFTISGRGSVKVGDGVTVDYGYSAFLFSGCSRFELRDLMFDGNRANRTPAELDAHTVNFYSCSYFTVCNVQSDNAVCDGFMLQSADQTDITTHCHHFVFDNCRANNAYRNGGAVVNGHDGLFIDGVYSGSNGTDPEAGIDLEALTNAATHTIKNITLIGVAFNNNNKRGLSVSQIKSPQNIRVIDCTFLDNLGGPLIYGSDGGCIENCYFDGFPQITATQGAIQIIGAAGVGSFDIVNPVFRRVTADYTCSLISIASGGDGNITISGLDVDSCATILQSACQNVRLIDSRRLNPNQTLQYAIDMSGADNECSNNFIANYYEGAIQMEGARPICRFNRCIEPSAHASGSYVINVTGANGVVEGNLVYRASSGAGHGIQLTAATDRLTNNTVTGFTGNPFTLTGTPVFNRGNIANGTKQTETAIT